MSVAVGARRVAFAVLALALAGAAAFAYLQAGKVDDSSAGRPWIYASIAAGLLAFLSPVAAIRTSGRQRHRSSGSAARTTCAGNARTCCRRRGRSRCRGRRRRT